VTEQVVIMGAAGRDFHNFNVYFRNNLRYRVVAFTAAQIPDIAGRCYPTELCGEGYPDGIPIFPESELRALVREHGVDLVAFSYSDVSYANVMHKASLVMAEGADFIVLGAQYTMLRSSKPVVSVCAVRTGCGKSPTTRKVCALLRARGLRPVVVRHPMPYGDLRMQVVQRFASVADLDRRRCTIEEREEYEPLLEQGIVVYAGVDYARILAAAEAEADVVVWDGGNNDTPFFRPDVHVVIFDPHRPGHELAYFPGEVNLLMAHVAVINKVDSARAQDVEQVRQNIARHNPGAAIVLARSEILVEEPERIRGRRVLLVGDGPTLTHGGMAFDAGTIAAERYGAAELVDPRPAAQGSLRQVYADYPHLGRVLPAMGYSERQQRELEASIDAVACDLVLLSTPVDLTRLIRIAKPALRVYYTYADHDAPRLDDVLWPRLERALRRQG